MGGRTSAAGSADSILALLTTEEREAITRLAETDEIVPFYAFLAARLGAVIEDDILWASSLLL